jgi:HK97 family phage major capsid protein
MADPGTDAIASLVREISDTRSAIQAADAARMRAIEGKASREEVQRIADAITAMSVKLNRPGAGALNPATTSLRDSARGLLQLKHQDRTPKAAPGDPPPNFSEGEIEEAEHAVRGLRHLMKSTSIDQLPLVEHKALTSFSMGASGFILIPEMSSQVLSCLTDITDLTGMVQNVTISAGSVKFMMDNVRLQNAGWACDTNCYANQPPGSFTEGLGELEIKAERLRFVVCASRDILADAAFNVETWMFGKVSDAFRNTISDSIVVGDGVGKPAGLLHLSSGIPICDTGPATPAGQLTWMDLVGIKYEVPVQWHNGAVYLMNQRVFGQILCMSDALGRPIMIASPVDAGTYMISGNPVKLATQMPDCNPGATPILFGNLKSTYLLVNRQQTTMLQDPFSLPYCVQFRFEARIGGNVSCANASRLLRIR